MILVETELCHFPLTSVVFLWVFFFFSGSFSVDYYGVKALVLGFIRVGLFGHSP